MKLNHLIQGAFIALIHLFSAPAVAQNYPSKPIVFVVPAVAGGATDVLARALAQQMGQQMGQQIIVENRPGAGGMLGAQTVANAPADGYTLFVTPSGPLLTSPHIFPNVKYDPLRDFALITPLCTGSLVLAVNSTTVPARNMKELMAWAESNRGKVSFGSFGVGSTAHLMGAYLGQLRNLDLTHVAYKGEAPMIQDLAGGQVPLAIGTSGVMAPHIQSGRIRPIAVLGDQRLSDLPDVPTMAEVGFPQPEFKPLGWAAIAAPARTPPEVLQRLEKEARAAVHTAAMKARFQIYGMHPLGTSSADFRRQFETQSKLVERLVKISGAKVN